MLSPASIRNCLKMCQKHGKSQNLSAEQNPICLKSDEKCPKCP